MISINWLNCLTNRETQLGSIVKVWTLQQLISQVQRTRTSIKRIRSALRKLSLATAPKIDLTNQLECLRKLGDRCVAKEAKMFTKGWIVGLKTSLTHMQVIFAKTLAGVYPSAVDAHVHLQSLVPQTTGITITWICIRAIKALTIMSNNRQHIWQHSLKKYRRQLLRTIVHWLKTNIQSKSHLHSESPTSLTRQFLLSSRLTGAKLDPLPQQELQLAPLIATGFTPSTIKRKALK